MIGFYHKGLDNVVEKFTKLEEDLRDSIIEAGGSISHHHGIGKHRSKFLIDFSSNSIESTGLKTLKNTIDPNNIFGINNNIFNMS